jgi:hypothetical protein
MTLDSESWNAIRGKGDTIGVALVEVYALE